MAKRTNPAKSTRRTLVSQVYPSFRGVAAGYNKLDGRTRLVEVMRDLERLSRRQALDWKIGTAIAYGVAWSYTTNRLSLAAEKALTEKDVRGLLDLVFQLAETCETVGEVWHKLNELYPDQQAPA